MADCIRKYIEAEISEMLCCIGKESRNDPDTFHREAIDWIDNNAASFRERWNNKQSFIQRDSI